MVEDAPSLIAAVESVGYPAFVKSCELGYDGQNQWLLRDTSALDALNDQMDALPLVVEGAVHFDRELSLIAARSLSGEIAQYALAENRHREGILLLLRCPPTTCRRQRSQPPRSPILCWSTGPTWVCSPSNCLMRAESYASMSSLPVAHNSGHWSQNAGVTSQFTNHIRAITDTRPGATNPGQFVGMVNRSGEHL